MSELEDKLKQKNELAIQIGDILNEYGFDEIQEFLKSKKSQHKSELIEKQTPIINLTQIQRIRKVAGLLRKHEGIEQIQRDVCKSDSKVCAYGLLGKHLGWSTSDLKKMTGDEELIANKFFMGEDFKLKINLPFRSSIFNGFTKNPPIPHSIAFMNDKGYSFDQIADVLDNYANNLEQQTKQGERQS